jgi:hypothetical protein
MQQKNDVRLTSGRSRRVGRLHGDTFHREGFLGSAEVEGKGRCSFELFHLANRLSKVSCVDVPLIPKW